MKASRGVRLETVAAAIRKRKQRGTNFSIVAVAEGALCRSGHKRYVELKAAKAQAKEKGDTKALKKIEGTDLEKFLKEYNAI